MALFLFDSAPFSNRTPFRCPVELVRPAFDLASAFTATRTVLKLATAAN